ncbi:Uncharacterized protein XB15_00960 [Leptospira santarosai]|nr:Uncharacterized protein XB15_00960 [Leptospira santarosai]
MRMIFRTYLFSFFILGIQCMTTLNFPVNEYDENENRFLAPEVLDRKICVNTEVFRRDSGQRVNDVEHYEISGFTSTVLDNLKLLGFKQIILLKGGEQPFCPILLRYTKIMRTVSIGEFVIIGYPIKKYHQLELDISIYGKDRKLIHSETLKNGYQHYISWLLLPTFFIFYRPFTDEKIIEDFHHQFFRQMNNLESQNYP